MQSKGCLMAAATPEKVDKVDDEAAKINLKDTKDKPKDKEEQALLNVDASDSGSFLAPAEDPALTAFNTLKALVNGQTEKNKDTPAKETKESKELLSLPPCLRAQAGGEGPFACLVCGGLKNSTRELVEHAERAHGVNNDRQNFDSVIDRTCSFCGLLFPSSVSRVLHQMSERIQPVCKQCGDEFENEQEKNTHLCTENTHLPLICPLGCPSQFRFDSSSLSSHLRLHHGTELGEHPELGARCPACGVLVNPLRKSLAEHISYQCSGMGKYHRECVRAVKDLAEETGIGSDLLLRLEAESFEVNLLPQLQTRADARYTGLPSDFFQRILRSDDGGQEAHLGDPTTAKVSRWLRSNAQFSQSFKDDERTEEDEVTSTTPDADALAAAMRSVRNLVNRNTSEDKRVHSRNPDYVDVRAAAAEVQPEADVLQRLEAELNFRVMGGTREIEQGLLMKSGFVATGVGSSMPPIKGSRKRKSEETSEEKEKKSKKD